MFEQQHFVDLQENGGFGDPKSWLSGEDQSSTTPLPLQRSQSSSLPNNGSNFDKVLYKNLVEMVPLVESLMDRRANTSFTRRASLICTKTPSRESYNRKNNEPKGRKVAQSIPAKKKEDLRGNESSKKSSFNDQFSLFSSRAFAVEKDREELAILQEQVQILQKDLLEKEELLKSTVTSIDQMSSVNEKLDELKRQTAEKDLLITSAHLQLSDAKIKLADKQAALEKLHWESTTSNSKVEKLQEDLESMRGELSVFMLLLDRLSSDDSIPCAEDFDASSYHFEPLPYIDDLDKDKLQEMEEAREEYLSAVVIAKENQDEESLAIAAKARSRLQSLVFGSKL